MKKTLLVLTISLVALPLAVSAQWKGTGESNEFTFPGVGVETVKPAGELSAGLRCRYDANKGAAIFRYSLPFEVKSATLAMYDISGSLIGAADVKAGNSILEWRGPGKRVPAGIYVAVLRYGTVEQKLQFSVIN